MFKFAIKVKNCDNMAICHLTQNLSRAHSPKFVFIALSQTIHGLVFFKCSEI